MSDQDDATACEVSDRIATNDWVKRLERDRPELVGQLGRAPTRRERRTWKRLSEKHKMELLAEKMRYLRSGLKSHMIRYLETRSRCGYVEGVPVPRWLLKAGST